MGPSATGITRGGQGKTAEQIGSRKNRLTPPAGFRLRVVKESAVQRVPSTCRRSGRLASETAHHMAHKHHHHHMAPSLP